MWGFPLTSLGTESGWGPLIKQQQPSNSPTSLCVGEVAVLIAHFAVGHGGEECVWVTGGAEAQLFGHLSFITDLAWWSGLCCWASQVHLAAKGVVSRKSSYVGHADTREWEILKYLMDLSWGKHRILNLNPSPDSQLWHGLRPTKGLLRPPEGLQLWRSPAEHICSQKVSKSRQKAELSYHQKGLATRNSSEATHPASQLC